MVGFDLKYVNLYQVYKIACIVLGLVEMLPGPELKGQLVHLVVRSAYNLQYDNKYICDNLR
jgi:hypothetical protein